MPHGGGEPGHVGDQPATNGDDDVVAGQSDVGERPSEMLDGHQRLALLAGADVDAHEVAVAEQGADRIGERDRRLGHDGDALRAVAGAGREGR